LSKTQAGILVGVFPLGLGLVAIPVGVFATRVGVKRLVVAGLLLLAVGSVTFGFSNSYDALLATRVIQGCGAALCWSTGLAWLVGAAPTQRRSEFIGIFTGAGAAGQILGPVVGGLAVLAGRTGVFTAVALVAVALMVVALRYPEPAVPEARGMAGALRVLRSRSALGGLWLVALPGLLFGTVFALSPLQLDRTGLGPVGIALTYLAAAAVGAIARPAIGRWADRRGAVPALRVLVVVAIPLTLGVPLIGPAWALALSVILAINIAGVLLSPAMTVASQSHERTRVPQVFGFAVIGFTTGVAFFLGSTTAGNIAGATSDAVAYGVAACYCVLTAAALAVLR